MQLIVVFAVNALMKMTKKSETTTIELVNFVEQHATNATLILASNNEKNTKCKSYACTHENKKQNTQQQCRNDALNPQGRRFDSPENAANPRVAF